MKKVILGKTGIEVSKLAVGTGTHGWNKRSEQTRKGFGWLVDHLIGAYELGVNYWDLADQYGSHDHAREALKSVPRDRVVVSTKTTETGYAGCKSAVERFLREIGTDYLDVVLLHAKHSADWTETNRGAVEALSEAKERGHVRAVGISVHGFGALKTASVEPWVDVILVRINYAGVSMDAPPDEVIPVLKRAHDNGKGIYAMKVMGCGPLTGDPERCIKYILDSDFIDAMTIGHTEDRQLHQNVQIIESFAP